MSIFCCDYVNGSDNNGGDSWGNPVLSGIDGVANGTTTFTSASGGFTGKESRWICIAGKGTFKINSVTNDTTVILSSTVSSGTGLTFNIGGAKQTINGCTAVMLSPGDTVKLAKSPDPTSLGMNGTWTNGPIPATKVISSSTNASPIVVTINDHGYITGDIVQIRSHTINTNANGTWIITKVTDNTFSLDGSTGNGSGGFSGTAQRINSKCVKLASSLTQTICNCGINWTAGTNVTSANTDSSDFKQGAYSVKIITNSSHAAAGVLAQYGLPSSLDLSGYQQISFWIKNYTSALTSAGDLKIKLYSDAACTTEVESFDVPAVPSTVRWVPLAVNKGSALSSTVQGIAVYGNIAMPSKTIYVDNFIACKAASSNDALSLQSLISKNALASGGTEGFYGIQAIDGIIVTLDNETNKRGNDGQGYYGTSETVAVYKRETIKTTMTSGMTTSVQAVQDCGSYASLISFEGGYNTISDIQDGESFFDGLNGCGSGIYATTKSYLSLNKIAPIRYYCGIYLINSSNNNELTVTNTNNNSYGIYLSGSNNNTLEVTNANNNYYNIYLASGSSSNDLTVINANNGDNGVHLYNDSNNNILRITNANNNNYGIFLIENSSNNTLIVTNTDYNGIGLYFSTCYNNTATITNANNNNYGVYFSSSFDNKLYNLQTAGNITAGLFMNCGKNYLFNCTINETTEVTGFTAFANGKLYSGKHGGIIDNNWIYCDGGTINSQTAVRHSTAGLAWKISPTSTNRSDNYPLTLSVAKIAVNANTQAGVKAWMKKSHATDITCKLVVRGKQIAGVDNDVVVTKANDTDWEELSLTFTPTEKGVVEVEAWAYSGSSTSDSVYIDDMSFSQA